MKLDENQRNILPGSVQGSSGVKIKNSSQSQKTKRSHLRMRYFGITLLFEFEAKRKGASLNTSLYSDTRRLRNRAKYFSWLKMFHSTTLEEIFWVSGMRVSIVANFWAGEHVFHFLNSRLRKKLLSKIKNRKNCGMFQFLRNQDMTNPKSICVQHKIFIAPSKFMQIYEILRNGKIRVLRNKNF